jgi:hypothetical protein
MLRNLQALTIASTNAMKDIPRIYKWAKISSKFLLLDLDLKI